MSEIRLVTMPMASVQRPSMALGLLKGHLDRAGLVTSTHYANLWFLDYAGLDAFQIFKAARAESGLADWLFASCVFPDAATDPGVFLDDFEQTNRTSMIAWPADWRATLVGLRRHIAHYLDWAADTLLEGEPRVIGCTSTFQQHMASLALLRRIRERAPGVVTMMGGANCETVMGRATHRAFPWVDYVASGEADEVIVPLMRLALDHGRIPPPGEVPPGILAPHHRESGYPSAGGGVPRNSVASLEDMPLPEYADYFAELERCLWRGAITPGVPIETARGCWWGAISHCTFCGLNGGNMVFRAKSATKVADEIEQLVARHGVTSIEAVDNIMDMTYLDTLMPRLAERRERLNIFFEVKSNLKPGQIAGLAQAGVTWIQPGIESLDSEILSLMGKGARAAAHIELLKACRQHGVRPSWTLLADFPGEDDAPYRRMAALVPKLTHLQPARVTIVRFDRFSPYFEKRQSWGLELQPAAPYRALYDLDEETLFDLAYYFEAPGRREVMDVGNRPPFRLAHRIGLSALATATGRWAALWGRPQPPVLLLEEGSRTIRDTRDPEKPITHELDDAEFLVLGLCDESLPAARLDSSAREHGLDPDTALDALVRLQERDLVIEIDRRLVSLVLRGPLPVLPDWRSFPGGHLASAPLRRQVA